MDVQFQTATVSGRCGVCREFYGTGSLIVPWDRERTADEGAYAHASCVHDAQAVVAALDAAKPEPPTQRRSDPFRARFASRCATCRGPIRVGAMIVRNRRGDYVHHGGCPAKASRQTVPA